MIIKSIREISQSINIRTLSNRQLDPQSLDTGGGSPAIPEAERVVDPRTGMTEIALRQQPTNGSKEGELCTGVV